MPRAQTILISAKRLEFKTVKKLPFGQWMVLVVSCSILIPREYDKLLSRAHLRNSEWHLALFLILSLKIKLGIGNKNRFRIHNVLY